MLKVGSFSGAMYCGFKIFLVYAIFWYLFILLASLDAWKANLSNFSLAPKRISSGFLKDSKK